MSVRGPKDLIIDRQSYYNKCLLERWKQELAQESGKSSTTKVTREFKRNSRKEKAHAPSSSPLWLRGKQIEGPSRKEVARTVDSSALWPRGEKVGKVWERCGVKKN